MLPTHALVLSQARAHIAALADQASCEETSAGYERVLLELDRLHQDRSPDYEPLGIRLDPDVLATIATRAIEDLVGFGVDPLDIELLLADLGDAREHESA